MLVGRLCSVWNCPFFRGHSFIFRGGNCWKHQSIEPSKTLAGKRPTCPTCHRTIAAFAHHVHHGEELILGSLVFPRPTEQPWEICKFKARYGFWGEVVQSWNKKNMSDLIWFQDISPTKSRILWGFPIATTLIDDPNEGKPPSNDLARNNMNSISRKSRLWISCCEIVVSSTQVHLVRCSICIRIPSSAIPSNFIRIFSTLQLKAAVPEIYWSCYTPHLLASKWTKTGFQLNSSELLCHELLQSFSGGHRRSLRHQWARGSPPQLWQWPL